MQVSKISRWAKVAGTIIELLFIIVYHEYVLESNTFCKFHDYSPL